jgi:hypothetical protein
VLAYIQGIESRLLIFSIWLMAYGLGEAWINNKPMIGCWQKIYILIKTKNNHP